MREFATVEQLGDLLVGPGGQDGLADAGGMNRTAAAGTEESAHRRVAFDLRNEDDVAAFFDADIRRLAAFLHQSF